jgi:6-methylsalicylic acid synthase
MNSPEPVAVIGMSCRFAGGIDSLGKFWTLLHSGRDSIGEIPGQRWDWYASQGRDYASAVRDVTKLGAFLEDVAGFDAEFFDITPREAALMDPQQRIVLELAWEALEHAGIVPRELAGTDTGVFVGVGSDDYGRRLLEDLPRIEAWTGIGGAYCAVANRVSYLLDLRGPSVAVDTACSSSLVSIHLAAQALRAGECPVALAGGVLVITAPGLSLVLDAAGATAPDGRSKSFDASADGYGRGEGGGMLVLKLLSQAQRDGDRVLAVIRGSAVHQDGKTNGIMAPNGQAQAHLMRRAYQSAGVDPATVGYVEAHGTGTRVGDPLEAQAMTSVFGPDRPADQPLLIGSVKPNVGHLEAGAGVAGVVKAVLALQHGEIPPSLNFHTPNPAIDWDNSGLRVVTEPTPWPVTGQPRRAGVSGYGYGGTIAHVILEQAETPSEQSSQDCGPALYPISGASEAAVAEYAGRLAEQLEADTELGTADLGYTLARRRAELGNRAAVFAADREQLVARLRELADSAGSTTGSPTGSVLPAAANGLVWIFSGHGSQWTGMARELLTGDRSFAEVMDTLEPIFSEEMGVSLREKILDDSPQPVDVIQPMIFAVQVGLAAAWRSHGVRPDAVIGHSVGEIAAAVTAGIFSLEHGARLVCRRSVLLRQVLGRGALAMVNLPTAEAERLLGDRSDVVVAVAASPGSAVIAGDIPAVAQLSEQWREQGLVVRPVDTDVAFHSPQMDPLLDALAAAAADLEPRTADLRIYSTALADPRSDAVRDGRYWATNLRGQVRFAQAVTAAIEDGYRLFVEISGHPVVEHSVTEAFEALGVEDAYVAHSLRRNRPEREELLTNLGLLYCHGASVDWSTMWPEGNLAALPTTAWQRRRHWAEEPVNRAGLAEQHDPAGHTLLGARSNVRSTTPAHVWLTYLDRDSRPYPGDHPVREVEIIPAAVLLNTFLTASAETGSWSDLTDVALRVPVSVTGPRDLQVVLQNGAIRLSSRIAEDSVDDKGWVTHTSAAIEAQAWKANAVTGASDVLADEDLPTDYVIQRLATLGVAAMGFGWAVQRISRGDGVLVAEVRADRDDDEAPATWASVLDAVLSIASVAFTGPPTLRMPAHIHRVTLAPTSPARARITVRVIGNHTVDVEIADLDGVVVGELSRLRYGILGDDVGAISNPRQLVHELNWLPAEPGTVTDRAPVVLVGPDTALLGRLTERLGVEGIEHRVAARPEDLHDSELAGEHLLVVVPALGSPQEIGDSAAEATWLLARTAQRLAETGSPSPSRLWCVTQGVQAGEDERALGHGSLWGLGRIIGGEYPEFWGGVVDIGQSPHDVAALIDVVRTVRGEDGVAISAGTATVARLQRVTGEPVRPLATCQPDGTYLITGGLGVLGLATAQFLADRGARRIVLAGRQPMPPRASWAEQTDPVQRARIDAILSLERLGVTVVTVALDIADADAVRTQLSPAGLDLPPIRGVVHLAGVLDNRMLRNLTEESLRSVMRPKVEGALVLHTLFPPGSLDFFVLFSSSGQLLGLPGQASYAAGNAFLDALAAHRRAAGDNTTSFGWTSWRGLGMSTSSAVIDAELAARGTADINVTEAFSSWELAERYDLGYAAVLRIVPLAPGEQRLPLLSLLAEEAPPEQADAAPRETPWVGLTGAELREYLATEIRTQVANETKLAASEVDARRPLVEMGVDSVMTVRIRRGLERRFQLSLPATLFWDRPTIEAVASLLAERLDRSEPEPAEELSA